MDDFKRKIKIMLALAFQECKADEKNPNDKGDGGEIYYKEYEDEEYFGYVYRDWWPADNHGRGGSHRPYLEEIYYKLWSKTVGRKSFDGIWSPSHNTLSVSRGWPTTKKDSLREHNFSRHPYYSPVPPERRVNWEANPTRPTT